MGRAGYKRRVDESRVPGGFFSFPHDVIDSAAYRGLSYSARALLVEFGRQLSRTNNGRLLASARYLRRRGWTSSATINKALRELEACRLIHKTVQGGRPNKASWYAVGWYTLVPDHRYDYDAFPTFRRGAYRDVWSPTQLVGGKAV